MARITSRVWGTFIKTLPITFHFEQTGDFKWLRMCMGFQSHDLILIGHPIGAHHLPVNIWPRVVFMIKKMVLCAIFGCGTQNGRDKGINMARIYLKLLLVEEKKYGNFPRRGETNGFLRSAFEEIFVVTRFHHMHLHVGTFVIFYMVFLGKYKC